MDHVPLGMDLRPVLKWNLSTSKSNLKLRLSHLAWQNRSDIMVNPKPYHGLGYVHFLS